MFNVPCCKNDNDNTSNKIENEQYVIMWQNKEEEECYFIEKLNLNPVIINKNI